MSALPIQPQERLGAEGKNIADLDSLFTEHGIRISADGDTLRLIADDQTGSNFHRCSSWTGTERCAAATSIILTTKTGSVTGGAGVPICCSRTTSRTTLLTIRRMLPLVATGISDSFELSDLGRITLLRSQEPGFSRKSLRPKPRHSEEIYHDTCCPNSCFEAVGP